MAALLWLGLPVVWGCSSPEERFADHLERAESFAAEGETQSALLEMRSALALFPNDFDARVRAGRLSEQAGIPLEAVEHYTVALAVHDDDALALEVAALLRSHDNARAKALADGVLEHDPKNVAALIERSEIALHTPDTEAAIRDARLAEALAPDDVEVQRQIARAHLARIHEARLTRERISTADLQAVLRAYDAIERLDPERHGSIQLLRAKLYSQWPGQTGLARELYQAVLAERNDGDEEAFLAAAEEAATFYREIGDDQALVNVLKRMVTRRPNDIATWERLAGAVAASGRTGTTRWSLQARMRILKQMIARNPQSARAHALFARGLAEQQGATLGIEHIEAKLAEGLEPGPLLIEKARLLLETSRAQEAAVVLDTLQDELGDQEDVRRLGVLIKLSLEDYEGALAELESWPDAGISPESLRLQAHAHAGLRQIDRAIELLDAAIASDPNDDDDEPFFRDKLRVLVQAGQYPRVINLLAQMRRRGWLTTDDQVTLAIAHYESGEDNRGRVLLQRLVVGDDAPPRAAVELARRERDNRALVPIIRSALESAWRARPKDVDVFEELVRYDIALGDPSAALVRFRTFELVNERTTPKLQLIRADALALSGKIPEALEAAREALQAGVPQVREEAATKLLDLYALMGRDVRVRQALEEKARTEKLPAFQLAVLGRLRNLGGDLASAKEAYEAALAAGVDHAIVKNDLALLLLATGEPARALELAKSAVAMEGAPAGAADTLGLCYLQAGEAEAAMWQFKAAIAGGASAAHNYYHLGLAQRETGDLEASSIALRKALEIDPDFADAAAARALLAKTQDG